MQSINFCYFVLSDFRFLPEMPAHANLFSTIRMSKWNVFECAHYSNDLFSRKQMENSWMSMLIVSYACGMLFIRILILCAIFNVMCGAITI